MRTCSGWRSARGKRNRHRPFFRAPEICCGLRAWRLSKRAGSSPMRSMPKSTAGCGAARARGDGFAKRPPGAFSRPGSRRPGRSRKGLHRASWGRKRSSSRWSARSPRSFPIRHGSWKSAVPPRLRCAPSPRSVRSGTFPVWGLETRRRPSIGSTTRSRERARSSCCDAGRGSTLPRCTFCASWRAGGATFRGRSSGRSRHRWIARSSRSVRRGRRCSSSRRR